MNTERELFEAAVERELNYGYDLMKDFEGNYPHDATDSMWVMWQAARTQPTPPASVEAALRELVEVEALKTRTEALHFIGPNGDLCDGWKAAYEAGRKEYIRRQPMAWDAARAALATPPAQPEPPFRPLMSDAAIEELINHSGGAWRDGEFRIDGKDLSTLLRGAFEAQPAPVVPEGHKLVPIEPTQAMLDAVVSTVDEMLLGQAAERQYREDWAAMLAAAPQPLPLHNVEAKRAP